MEKTSKWIFIAVFLIMLFLITFFTAGAISLFVQVEEPITGNTVIIPIKGVILADRGEMFGQQVASASDIVKNIEKANKAANVKAIIFEINSPGGAVVASEEIVSAIKKLNKTTVAYIREMGTSGAYWAASAADHIIASRMSLTGSIGVIASYLQFSGFLERYNVTYQRIIAGEYKDTGSPFKELTYNEELLLQKQMDLIHDYFIKDVAENRNLSEDSLNEIKTAKLFLGIEAMELGLIDEFGSKDEAIIYVEKKLNITADVNEISEKRTLFDMFGSVMNEKSFFVGKGIGAAFLNKKAVNEITVWS